MIKTKVCSSETVAQTMNLGEASRSGGGTAEQLAASRTSQVLVTVVQGGREEWCASTLKTVRVPQKAVTVLKCPLVLMSDSTACFKIVTPLLFVFHRHPNKFIVWGISWFPSTLNHLDQCLTYPGCCQLFSCFSIWITCFLETHDLCNLRWILVHSSYNSRINYHKMICNNTSECRKNSFRSLVAFQRVPRNTEGRLWVSSEKPEGCSDITSRHQTISTSQRNSAKFIKYFVLQMHPFECVLILIWLPSDTGMYIIFHRKGVENHLVITWYN